MTKAKCIRLLCTCGRVIRNCHIAGHPYTVVHEGCDVCKAKKP